MPFVDPFSVYVYDTSLRLHFENQYDISTYGYWLKNLSKKKYLGLSRFVRKSYGDVAKKFTYIEQVVDFLTAQYLYGESSHYLSPEATEAYEMHVDRKKYLTAHITTANLTTNELHSTSPFEILAYVEKVTRKYALKQISAKSDPFQKILINKVIRYEKLVPDDISIQRTILGLINIQQEVHSHVRQ